MSVVYLRRLGGGLLFLGLIAAPVLPAHAQTLPFSATDPAAPVYPYRSDTQELPAAPHRQVVAYATNEQAGTVIIDPAHTFLYLILGDGKALRYGIGVGREGFEWSGAERISRKAEWPDWIPPPASPICRAGSAAAPAIRSAPARFTSVIPITGFTGPMTRPRSANTCRADASACSMPT
jgi:hypothetical protein